MLPLGQGMFGAAVERRELVVTGNYLGDPGFRHSDVADRIATTAGMRSMAVAPLLAEGEVLGALGAYAARVEGFGEAELGLLRALADHAAAAIWNLRLIERLARLTERLSDQAHELGRRVEVQRTLADIAGAISSLREPAAVLQRAVDEAVRLLGADGGLIDQLDPETGVIDWGPGNGAVGQPRHPADAEAVLEMGEGIAGLAMQERRVAWTGDYLEDDSFVHSEASDSYARRRGFRSVDVGPASGWRRPIGDPQRDVDDARRVRRGRRRGAPDPRQPRGHRAHQCAA